MSERTSQLIELWLDGVLDDAGVAELESAVLESAETRREFWDRAAFHGLVREAAKMRFDTGPAASAAPVVPVGGSQRGSSQRLMGAMLSLVLIGGCGMGTIVSSMAWSYSTPRRFGVVVHHEGFESPPPPALDYVPHVPDVWSGDETEVVDAEGGIQPYSGQRMLRFVSNHPRGADYAGKSSEIWRIVDLTTLDPRAPRGGTMAEITAVFNDLPVAHRTTTACGLVIVATDTKPDSVDQPWLYELGKVEESPMNLAVARTEEVLDEDISSWQRLSAVVSIPPGARYLLLHCYVGGRRLPGDDAWSPSGQCIDDIELTLYPQRRLREAGGSDREPGGTP